MLVQVRFVGVDQRIDALQMIQAVCRIPEEGSGSSRAHVHRVLQKLSRGRLLCPGSAQCCL